MRITSLKTSLGPTRITTAASKTNATEKEKTHDDTKP
jgi:hypothetical protein